MYRFLSKRLLKENYRIHSYYIFKKLYRIEIYNEGKVIAILNNWKEAYMYLKLLNEGIL